MQNWTREAQPPRGKTFSSIEIAPFSQTNQGKLAKLQQDMGWSHSADNVLMRLFLNANVLFTAAHYPGRKAAFIIELGAQAQWEQYSSAYALEEARRNLINSPKTCRGKWTNNLALVRYNCKGR